jgi:spore germination protein KC
MQKKVSLLLILVLITSFTFTGCYDAMEVDDEVYALAVGVDVGVNNKLIITIQYPTYKSSGGGASGGGGPSGGAGNLNALQGSNVQTIEAATILEGIDMFGMAISRRVSLSHTKLLVFSEEFARAGIGYYIAPIARFRETRRTMGVVVVRGKAEDFIKANESNIGESLTKTLELMVTQARYSSYFPEIRFSELYRGILSQNQSPAAIYAGINDFKKIPEQKETTKPPLVTSKGFVPDYLPRKGVEKQEFVGMAVFNGDKMVGYLDSYETRYYLLVTGNYNRGIMTFKDKYKPDNALPIDIRLGRDPIIKSHFENGKPVIDIKLNIEGDVCAIQSRINYERVNMIGDLNNLVKEQIEAGVKATIRKTQKELKADVFGFGNKVVENFWTIQDWEAYNWLGHYPEAQINVEVEVNVRRTGSMVYSSPIIDSSGKKGGGH